MNKVPWAEERRARAEAHAAAEETAGEVVIDVDALAQGDTEAEATDVDAPAKGDTFLVKHAATLFMRMSSIIAWSASDSVSETSVVLDPAIPNQWVAAVVSDLMKPLTEEELERINSALLKPAGKHIMMSW
jgi:hypothetical protein